ncbi:MAG: diadenylate cyclase CdaA [Oscillospiraceae bacterium]|nr:diadenylate cyclase CdaA [Oscillospiraceae bacterium]
MDRVQEWLGTAWYYIQNSAQIVTVWDVLDMAIVAFLIYKLLTFVQKTNSANVIKGIMILLVAMLLAYVMHLSVLSYLLNRIFELGIFILVILFQPEIRRILEQMGNSKLTDFMGGRQNNQDLDSAITQTVLACTDMSESRTGALIVFERSVNLDAYIKTGTIVDAAPVVELLKNIFYNKAPLHDGAVIIRDGRIAGAACMLPLSGNNNISRSLGMRHRAGIGMSERSDAVVVIVSEETGDISVAIEGMLKRGVAPETLEKLIRAELLPDDKQKKGFFSGIRSLTGSGR